MVRQVRIKAFDLLVILTAIAASGTALAADDDRPLLQAYSSLLTGAPPSMAMDGEIKPGRQINLTGGVMKFGPKTGQRFASGDLLSLGPGQCIVQKLMISQGDKEWAQTSLITYDFSRVQKLRYLADDDDYEKAESRKPDDPKVTTIWIEGDNLHCQQVLHIDPAKPQHFEVCEKSWTVILSEPDDKKAAMAALDMIGAKCFKK